VGASAAKTATGGAAIAERGPACWPPRKPDRLDIADLAAKLIWWIDQVGRFLAAMVDNITDISGHR
jgi:hypothetical protein